MTLKNYIYDDEDLNNNEEQLWDAIISRFKEKERNYYLFGSNELGYFFESYKKANPSFKMDVEDYFYDLCESFEDDAEEDDCNLEYGYKELSISLDDFIKDYRIYLEWTTGNGNGWDDIKLSIEKL